MVLWIVLGVLTLFFAFVAYKSTKVWNAAHIALVSGIYVMVILFAILAAANLRTRTAWMKRVNDLTSQTEQAQKKQAGLVQAIDESKAELARIVQLRGQVWRNMFPVDRKGDAFVLNAGAWGDASWRRLGLAGEEPAAETPPAEPTPPAEAAAPAEGAAAPEEAAPAEGGAPAEDAAPAEGTPPADEAAPAAATAEGATPAATTPAEATPPAAATPAPTTPTPPAGTGKPHGIVPQMVVHAFIELPIKLEFIPEPLRVPIQTLLLKDPALLEKDPKGMLRLPFIYLGEFRVEQAEGNLVMLQPNYPLNPQLVAMAGQSSWSLYDTAPRDSRDIFAGAPPEQLQALFAAMMNLPPDNVLPLVNEYLRDGQDAQPTDPVEQQWTEVKFVKEHAFEVDVPADGQTGLPEKPFDVNGRARDPFLRHAAEGPATVPVDAQGIFDRVTAQALVASGDAQKVRDVYLRRLRDYAFDFQNSHGGIRANLDRASVVQRNLQILQQSKETLDKQIAYRTQERAKLQGDVAGFTKEQNVLKSYLSDLQARIDELQQTLKTLYLNNQRLVSAMQG